LNQRSKDLIIISIMEDASDPFASLDPNLKDAIHKLIQKTVQEQVSQ